MFIKKTTVSVFLLLCLSTFSFSQTKLIDSLRTRLLSEKNDTIKAKILGDLTWYNKSISIDSSLKYGNKALLLLNKIDLPTMLAQQYSDIAGVYMLKGDMNQSKSYYFKGINIRSKLNDTLGIAKIKANLSALYTQYNQLDSAMVYGIDAMRVFEKKGHIRYANILKSNIASLYENINAYDKALEYHYEVLEYYTKVNDKSFLANLYNNIGKTLTYKGDTLESIKAYKKAFSLAKESNNILTLGISSANLGNIYSEQGKHNLAIKEYEKSLKYRKNLNSELEIASLKLSLGTQYFNNSNFKNSKKYLLECLPYFENNNVKNKLPNIYYHLIIISAYEQDKKMIQYYTNKDEINSLNLVSEQRKKEIVELETQYQTEKKEKEIALQKKVILENELKIKNRNLFATLLIATLLLLGIFFYGIYKRNKLKQSQLQKEIELKDALSTIKTQNKLQEQRLRISRDLHDNIGSQLTFIISSIDNLKFISKDLNEKVTGKLSNISAFTSDTIFQLRDTIWAMNKNNISPDDIQARVLSFIEKAKTAKPNIEFVTKFTLDNSKVLTSIQGMNIFRVLQEAINNSIKYANASQIVIEATETKDQIKFNVVDNGKGFDITTIELGNGLSNMEKRMGEINGKVLINSKPNQGTSIKIICNL